MVIFNASDPLAGTEYYDIPIEDPALAEYGFTRFRLPINDNAIKMILENDKDRSLITYVDFDRRNLGNSVKLLQDMLLNEQIIEDKAGKHTVADLVAYFRNACMSRIEDKDPDFEFFKNGNGSGKSKKSSTKSSGKKSDREEQKSKPSYTAYKYSNSGKVALHESVILADRPAFIAYENGKIQAFDVIEEDTKVIKPPYPENYPYKPYEFASVDEILKYRDRAVGENIDSLYLKAKQIAIDYNDQRKEKISLLAIEIISSYFQDRFPTTHYDIVLGGNGSGKSTFGETFTAVGYRVVNLTDPNAANINRILGSVEIGQCTIVSDETGAIDKQPDLLSLLKTGYSPTGRTSKINDFSRIPEFFYTYCFKMIISERMPNLREAKGVVDRSFTFTTYKGVPKYDIKETLESQGNQARQHRLDALNDFRKLMLIYRLIHFKDEIHDIDIGVEGREKELSKPIIQLFYNIGVQNEVETTLHYFLNLRSEKKEITLEPILHPIVTKLVSADGTEISNAAIWEELKNTVDGHPDEKKPYEYHTLEYGTIYNTTISNILEHTFGGRPRHRAFGNTFIFDPDELVRVGKAYNLTTKIQTKLIVTEENQRLLFEDPEGFKPISKGPADSGQNVDLKGVSNSVKNIEHLSNISKESGNIITQKFAKEREPSVDTSAPSASSNNNQEDCSTAMKHDAYWIQSKGLWGCNRCKLQADKFEMQNSSCSGGVRRRQQSTK